MQRWRLFYLANLNAVALENWTLQLRDIRFLPEQDAACELQTRFVDHHVLGRDMNVSEVTLQRALAVDGTAARERVEIRHNFCARMDGMSQR